MYVVVYFPAGVLCFFVSHNLHNDVLVTMLGCFDLLPLRDG